MFTYEVMDIILIYDILEFGYNIYLRYFGLWIKCLFILMENPSFILLKGDRIY